MKFKGIVIISDIDGTYTGSPEGVRKNNEAIEYFKKDIENAPTPRFVDPFDAIAHICEIRGDYAGAVEMYREAIEVMKNEWNETERQLSVRSGHGHAHKRDLHRHILRAAVPRAAAERSA